MISCLAFEMSWTILAEPTLEDVVLELVQLGAHLAQHRERGVHAGVDDLVQQVPGSLGEHALAHLLALAIALEHRRQRGQDLVGQGDQVVGAHEQVDLGRQQAPAGLVEHGEVENDEQVVVVGVELGALVARCDVLDRERVEAELPLEPLPVSLARPLQVQPADARCADDLRLDVLGDPFERTTDGARPASTQARAQQQVRHLGPLRTAWGDPNAGRAGGEPPGCVPWGAAAGHDPHRDAAGRSPPPPRGTPRRQQGTARPGPRAPRSRHLSPDR